MQKESLDYTFLFPCFIDQVSECAIYMLDPEGYISSWNAGAERIEGYTEKEVIGQHLQLLFSAEELAAGKPEEELRQARQQGHARFYGWRQKKDGTRFWANTVLTSIVDAEQQLLGFTRITRDLTEEKKAADEFEQKQEELLRVNQDMDNFIHIASHDLRAPITNIAGLISGLQSMLRDHADPDVLAYIHLVEVSIKRFNQTIQELTAVRKLNQGLGEVEAETIDIPTLLQDQIESLMESRSGSFQVDTDFQVRELHFSRSKFRSILYNLLSNAVKYAAPDRPCRISISTWESKGFMVLSVKDNGLGIPQADQQELFKMFKRFHPQVEGSGIGLYTTKKLVDAAGGRITFSSQENEGSEFLVYFRI